MAKSKYKFFMIDAKSFLTDPYLNTPARRGNYCALMALAKVINCDGAFLTEVDRPMSLVDLTKSCQVSQKALSELIQVGKLTKVDGVFKLTNWSKYQPYYDRRRPLEKARPQDKPAPRLETETREGELIQETRDLGNIPASQRQRYIKICRRIDEIDNALPNAPSEAIENALRSERNKLYKELDSMNMNPIDI